MIKISAITLTLLLASCGGGGGSATISGNEDNTSNISQDTTDKSEETTYSGTCKVDNGVIVVDEGDTCETNGYTLTCNNDRVTINGGLNITAKTYNDNGTIYSCSSSDSVSAEEANETMETPTTSESSETSEQENKTDVEESSAKNILEGKTLYEAHETDFVNGYYSEYIYGDNTVQINTYIRETGQLFLEDSYPVVYELDIMKIIRDDNTTVECVVSNESISYLPHTYALNNCVADGEPIGTILLTESKEDGKKYPVITVERRTLQSDNIVNSSYTAPIIRSFSIEANRYVQDAKAEIDSYFRDGANVIKLEMNRDLVGDQRMYLFFNTQKAQDIQSTGNQLTISNVNSTLSFNMNVKESGIFEYSLDGGTSAMINDSEKFPSFPAEGYLNVFVCQDASLSLSTCNYASIPVKLY